MRGDDDDGDDDEWTHHDRIARDRSRIFRKMRAGNTAANCRAIEPDERRVVL